MAEQTNAPKHAILSPSHAHTWLYCLAAPSLEKDFPESESPYAAEGTKAHALAEKILRWRYEGYKAPDWESLDKEMLDYVNVYANHISEIIDKHRTDDPALFFAFEYAVNIEGVTGEKDAKGTIDNIVVTGDTLYINDLKYGAGVPVKAEKNLQMAIYALAALDRLSAIYDISKVVLTIIQPRCGGINSWETTVEVLERFRANIKPRAERAIKIYNAEEKATEADYHVSEDACRFCRAKSVCKAYTESVKGELLADYEAIDKKSEVKPESKAVVEAVKAIQVPSDPKSLAHAFSLVPIIKDWCAMVEESVTARLGQGEAIPGYKLVAGRKGARKWADEAKVEYLMKAMRIKRDIMYTMKLISPTQFEKAVKSGDAFGKGQIEKLRGLIVAPEGKPSVVSEDDPRPALAVASASDYDEVNSK